MEKIIEENTKTENIIFPIKEEIFLNHDSVFISNPLLILKTKKFPTCLKYFKSKNPKIEDEKISFFYNFPKLFKLVSEQFNYSFHQDKKINNPTNSNYIEQILNDTYTNKDLCKAADDLLRLTIRKSFSIIDSEISLLLKEEWKKLIVYFEGSTRIHIIIAVVMVYLDVNHESVAIPISEYDKNILYWALLLHDISKHIVLNTDLSEHFNHAKPSGATALRIFYRNGFLVDHSELEEKVELVYDLLINSVELVEVKKSKRNKQKNIYIHNHKNLDKILENLSYISEISPKNEWIVDVIILIIFHQSLPNNKEHWNNPQLEHEIIKKIFDERMLELMRIVMINDSAAHSLFSNKSFSDEIILNLDNLKNEIF